MKLMTKEIENKLAKRPIGSTEGAEDPKVICKFFYPRGRATWYVIEGDKLENGDWEFYGLADVLCPELGYFHLSELEGFRDSWGLGIERDRYFTPCPLSKIKEEIGA